MSGQRPVVVGVDETPDAAGVVGWAAAEASARGLPLTVVGCYKSEDMLGYDEQADDVQFLRWRTQRTVDEHVKAAGERYPALPVTGELEAAAPVQALIGRSAHAELVVVGSRRMSRLASYFVGSVGSALTVGSTCPLVIVRARQEFAQTVNEIVAGIDLTPAAQDVLGYAFAHARCHRASLRIVTCARPELFTASEGRFARPLRERIEPCLSEVVAGWRNEFPDVPMRTELLLEAAVPALVHVSAGAALLVVGKHRRGHLPTLGSVAQGVVHHSTCPVGIVPVTG
jgi:nucleotide-binding universal stress UspA family protein